MNMNEVSKHPLVIAALTATLTLVTGYFGFVKQSEIIDTQHTLKLNHLEESHIKHEEKDTEQDRKIAAMESLVNSYSTLPPRVTQLEQFTQSFASDLNQIRINQSLQKNDADHMLHDLDELKELLNQLVKNKDPQ